MAHTLSRFDRCWWVRRSLIYVAAWRSKMGRGRVVIWHRRVWCDRWVEVRMSAAAGWQWGGAKTHDSITTMTGHIWWESSKRHGQVPVRNTEKLCSNVSTSPYLDCGSVSVLSFNSSSETSVSRISGFDLFPYLRQTRREGKGWWFLFKMFALSYH